MTLTQRYRRLVESGEIRNDPAQSDALGRLEQLCQVLGTANQRPSLVERLFVRSARPRPRGIYLYGGVGTGKSMLMDLFFEATGPMAKRRVHFHAFMQEVQEALHERRRSGSESVLEPVADGIAASAELLCLDEMQITDIADAMIVGRLFEQFFEAGMTVVTTSNLHPDDLYAGGLNRQLFLPFIRLLTDHLDVVHMDGDVDHRKQQLKGERRYFWPDDDTASRAVEAIWDKLTGGTSNPLILRNKGRDIRIPAFCNGIAKAGFSDLCRDALGPGDLLLVANSIRLLLLSGIPVMSDADRDPARRFVTLIDALYEARIPLVASAAAAPEDLYPSGKGAFEFRRTASRLVEMQSEEWCADCGG